MYAVDPRLLAVLLDDHEMTTQVFVLRANGLLVSVPVTHDSYCDGTLTSQVTRQASLDVDFSQIQLGLFDPSSDKVIIRTRVPGWPDIPMFMGRPISRTDRPDGGTTITCMSFSDDVIYDDFIRPWVVSGQYSSVFEMINIIKDVDPTFGVTYDSVLVGDGVLSPPSQTFETDRGRALDELGKGVNAIWMSDRTGGFTISKNPFAYAVAPSTPLTLADGVNGVLVDVQHTQARGKAYNSITVVVERSDNTIPPLRVTVQDLNPNSTTRYGGPFGRRNRTVKTQSAFSVGDALAFARQLLNSQLSLVRTWRIQVPHMPIIDPGDFITVWYRGEVTSQVVETVRYNLFAKSPTELTTRQFVSNVGTDVTNLT
jgi:hypothetical protein